MTEAAEDEGMGGGEDVDVGGLGEDFGVDEIEHGWGEVDTFGSFRAKIGIKDAGSLGDEGRPPTCREFKDFDFEPEEEEVGLVMAAEEVEEIGHPCGV